MNNFTNLFLKYNFPSFGWTRLPKPYITKQNKLDIGLKENDSNNLFLSTLCYRGFEEKFLNKQIKKEECQKYTDRCKLELDTFNELNFTNYILLVWTVINKAKELDIFLDFGRGSVSSSLICWLLNISGCDPIKNNLFFSRFVSKARAQSKIIDKETWISIELAPDVDLNLGEGRDEIIAWLKEIYPNRICKISNIVTLTGKICIKDVYKCLEEVDEEEAKRVADMVERIFGVVQNLKEVYKNNIEFKEWADKHKETYTTCLKLENLIRQYSSHASGYLISYDKITSHTPLILDSDKNITSAYTMDDVQSLKLDLLGLDTNCLIKDILNQIRININDIDLENDPIIYDQFQNRKLLPYGLYQISSHSAYRVCLNLKPKNVIELSHVNAIARPAALRYEKPYIENNNKCPHPLFEEALRWTRYQPLYQEQTLQMVKAIGFTEDEAEQFRRCFAKKKLDEVDEWVEKVKNKIKEQNLPIEAADILINLAKESASYQFNLSHSLSTSYLTALTVYLKYKYPLQFYTACLNNVKNNKQDTVANCISQIKNELIHFNIELKSPSLVYSDIYFKNKENCIYFGLGYIKGIAEKSIEKLNKFRNEYSDKYQIFHAAEEAELNISVLSALILVGALDSTKYDSTRSKLTYEAQIYRLLTSKEKKYIHQFGSQFNFDLVKTIKFLLETKNEKGKPIIKPSRFETIKKHALPYQQIYEFNKKNEEYASWFFERTLLGYSYSTNLLKIFKPHCPDLISILEATQTFERDRVHIIGEITDQKEWKSREKKLPCMKLKIQDHTSNCEILFVNSDTEDRIGEIIENNGRKPKEGDIVIIRASKGSDIFFGRSLSIQENSVFMRISQLKDIELTKIPENIS